MPLRIFLGVTFIYAGLQKIADRHFFDAKAPSSIQAQLHAYSRGSPIGGLLALASHLPVAAGVLVILLEVAAGMGALLGLWTRAAAVIGMGLSLTFWLAVSWHDYPYFLGPDVVFLVAWTPILIAGADVWSVDSAVRARARKEMRLAPAGPVAIDFAVVRKLCGAFERGACRLRQNRSCDPAACPVLADQRPMRADVAADLDRRTFLKQSSVMAAATGAALVFGGATAAVARAMGHPKDAALAASAGSAPQANAPTTAAPAALPPTSPSAPAPAAPAGPHGPAAPATSVPARPAPAVTPAGTPVLAASRVPVGGAAVFTDPASGDPAFALQPAAGRYEAFSAVCTHRGCEVEYAASQRAFVCPCHGAVFDAANGGVLQGPARRPLAAIPLTLGSDGRLYR